MHFIRNSVVTGQTRKVTFDDAPAVDVGDSVRLVGDTLEPRRCGTPYSIPSP